MIPAVTIRSPNLGHPALVRYTPENVSFQVMIAGAGADLDVADLLRSRLFLQSLVDTRLIFQECRYPPPLLDKGQKIPERVRGRLIPLSVRTVRPAVASPWYRSRVTSTDHVVKDTEPARFYPYAYSVTLEVPRRYAHCLRVPALYNLIDAVPNERFDVKFHAVYVHDNNWRDFTVAHACDLHVAWRNDFIPERLSALGKPVAPKKYVNFNDHVRDFIAYANRKHAAGELDLIVANGDIVDYIYPGDALRPVKIWEYPGASDRYATDNFEYLHDLLIGRTPASLPNGTGIVSGEELEVPIFTILGNHDYRLNGYPLIFEVDATIGLLSIGSHRDEKYKLYGLTEDQALAFEGGLHTHTDDVVSYYTKPVERPDDEPLPRSYALFFNADANYVVPLGRNRLVCLDTQSDEGIVTTEFSYLFRSGSQADFIGGHPDSLGFDDAQLDLLSNAVKSAEGTVVMACHAPPVNLRGFHNTPHHLMRECEHVTLDTDDQAVLLMDIARNRLDWRIVNTTAEGALWTRCVVRVEGRGASPGTHPTEDEKKKGRNTGQWMDVRLIVGDVPRGGQVLQAGSKPFRVGSFGGPDRILDDVKVGDYVGLYRGMPDRYDSFHWDWKKLDLPHLVDRVSADVTGSWSLMSEYFFKSKDRDPYMGSGVAHAGFERLVDILIGREVPGSAVDLVLSGHAHQSIEFRLSKLDNKIRYAHDYYLDNTIHGLSAKEFWKKPREPDALKWPRFDPALVPDYPDPLNSSNDVAGWWRKHRPLLVQTASIGVNPGGKDGRGTPGAVVMLVRVQNDVITSASRVLVKGMKAPKGHRKTAPTQALVALEMV